MESEAWIGGAAASSDDSRIGKRATGGAPSDEPSLPVPTLSAREGRSARKTAAGKGVEAAGEVGDLKVREQGDRWVQNWWNPASLMGATATFLVVVLALGVFGVGCWRAWSTPVLK